MESKYLEAIWKGSPKIASPVKSKSVKLEKLISSNFWFIVVRACKIISHYGTLMYTEHVKLKSKYDLIKRLLKTKGGLCLRSWIIYCFSK
jgi:hypothetical protein